MRFYYAMYGGECATLIIHKEVFTNGYNCRVCTWHLVNRILSVRVPRVGNNDARSLLDGLTPL